MLYQSEREKLANFVKNMYERKVTNSAGGNVSVKIDENHFIMTPRLMSEEFHCNLRPDQILVIDRNENVIEGDGEVTREVNMHMACYEENPEIGAVVHAHALESMTFSTLGINMPNLTEATEKIGTIRCFKYHKAMTMDLANAVRKQVRKDQQATKAYLINRHGILVTGPNLEKAYDMAERLEWNAKIAKEKFVYEKLS